MLLILLVLLLSFIIYIFFNFIIIHIKIIFENQYKIISKSFPNLITIVTRLTFFVSLHEVKSMQVHQQNVKNILLSIINRPAHGTRTAV